jgi:transcription initiation factor TFIIF subunit beta
MTVTVGGKYAEAFPKQYNLFYNQATAPMQIFAQDKEGQLSMEGTVEYKCDIKPQFGQDYESLCRDRLEQSLKKPRSLKTIEDTTPEMTKASLIQFNKKNKYERSKKLEKDELLDLLFGLFEKDKHWEMKSLSNESKQPVVSLMFLYYS